MANPRSHHHLLCTLRALSICLHRAQKSLKILLHPQTCAVIANNNHKYTVRYKYQGPEEKNRCNNKGVFWALVVV